MYVYRTVTYSAVPYGGHFIIIVICGCEREPQNNQTKNTHLPDLHNILYYYLPYSTFLHPHSPFPHGRVCFFLSPSPKTRVRLDFSQKKIMPNIKTIELPLGNTTARCTIELPDPATRPQDPAAVVDFTYDLVAWVVKIASEITSTKELQVSTANHHHHHHHHDPQQQQQHSGTRQV